MYPFRKYGSVFVRAPPFGESFLGTPPRKARLFGGSTTYVRFVWFQSSVFSRGGNEIIRQEGGIGFYGPLKEIDSCVRQAGGGEEAETRWIWIAGSSRPGRRLGKERVELQEVLQEI